MSFTHVSSPVDSAPSGPIHIGFDDACQAIGWEDAIQALEDHLAGGFEPEDDISRIRNDFGNAEYLNMPSIGDRHLGTKLLTLVDDNPASGLPFIQGVFVLFDRATGAVLASIDGIALTNVRTAAVTALALKHLRRKETNRLVVFGSGVQAREHIKAVCATVAVAEVVIVGRSQERAAQLAEDLASAAPLVRVGSVNEVADADIVVCATTAVSALFDGELIADHAIVASIGSHTATTRETDDALVRRAHIYVEARGAAAREAGDIIIPASHGIIDPSLTTTLRELVTGNHQVPSSGPLFFKSTGMSWEDLAVASRIYELHMSSGRKP